MHSLPFSLNQPGVPPVRAGGTGWPSVSGQVGAWAKTDTVVLFDHFIVDSDSE